jgi:predicted ATPase
MFRRLRLKNFRSFAEVDIELGPLNILVGANAAGKTNLVQAFRFLRDLARHGLDAAVSAQGGAEYLPHLNSNEREVFLSIELMPPVPLSSFTLARGEGVRLQMSRIHYEIRLRILRTRSDVSIASERLAYDVVLQVKEQEHKGQVCLSRKGSQVQIEAVKPLLDLWISYWGWPTKRKRFTLDGKFALIQFSWPPIAHTLFQEMVEIYDFLPSLARQAVPTPSQWRLSESGDNLPVVLNRLLASRNKRERLLEIVQLVLPHVSNLRTLPIGQHLTLQMRESFLRRDLPAFLLSNGTIEVIALIVALFFSDHANKLLIFEEPDRNLHPAILGRVMSLLEDASESNQILITTHNPELLRLAKLDWLLLVERTREGYSVVKRPADSERVRIFMEKQLGLDYLHVNQMLGV